MSDWNGHETASRTTQTWARCRQAARRLWRALTVRIPGSAAHAIELKKKSIAILRLAGVPRRDVIKAALRRHRERDGVR